MQRLILPAHPQKNISPAIAAALRQSAAKAELQGSLCDVQLTLIYAQNWFNMFVPKAMGGLELTLPEALVIEEAIAWADGSTGWTVTLCGGANWFVGFMDAAMASLLFTNKKVCLAGSGKPSGIAEVTGTGYTITGQWQYATGAPNATAFTANCMVEKDGIALTAENGEPQIASFIFLPGEVTVYNDWHTTGMVATASHRFAVQNLFVPGNRRFEINPKHAILAQPVYQYPFLQFAEATLSVNACGMAARFLQLSEEALLLYANGQAKKANAAYTFKDTIDKAALQLQTARDGFYAQVQLSWQNCVSNIPQDDILLHKVSNASHRLAQIALGVVDTLYPFCGLAAATHGTEINRVWRNLHTASQHTLFMQGYIHTHHNLSIRHPF